MHLPTPLLNQRMGACEVYLLPPKACLGCFSLYLKRGARE